jgi:hypothetical protein
MAGYSAGFSIAGSSAVLHDPRNDAALKQGAVTLIVSLWPRLAGPQPAIFNGVLAPAESNDARRKSPECSRARIFV